MRNSFKLQPIITIIFGLLIVCPGIVKTNKQTYVSHIIIPRQNAIDNQINILEIRDLISDGLEVLITLIPRNSSTVKTDPKSDSKKINTREWFETHIPSFSIKFSLMKIFVADGKFNGHLKDPFFLEKEIDIKFDDLGDRQKITLEELFGVSTSEPLESENPDKLEFKDLEISHDDFFISLPLFTQQDFDSVKLDDQEIIESTFGTLKSLTFNFSLLDFLLPQIITQYPKQIPLQTSTISHCDDNGHKTDAKNYSVLHIFDPEIELDLRKKENLVLLDFILANFDTERLDVTAFRRMVAEHFDAKYTKHFQSLEFEGGPHSPEKEKNLLFKILMYPLREMIEFFYGLNKCFLTFNKLIYSYKSEKGPFNEKLAKIQGELAEQMHRQTYENLRSGLSSLKELGELFENVKYKKDKSGPSYFINENNIEELKELEDFEIEWPEELKKIESSYLLSLMDDYFSVRDDLFKIKGELEGLDYENLLKTTKLFKELDFLLSLNEKVFEEFCVPPKTEYDIVLNTYISVKEPLEEYIELIYRDKSLRPESPLIKTMEISDPHATNELIKLDAIYYPAFLSKLRSGPSISLVRGLDSIIEVIKAIFIKRVRFECMVEKLKGKLFMRALMDVIRRTFEKDPKFFDYLFLKLKKSFEKNIFAAYRYFFKKEIAKALITLHNKKKQEWGEKTFFLRSLEPNLRNPNGILIFLDSLTALEKMSKTENPKDMMHSIISLREEVKDYFEKIKELEKK